MIAGVLTHEVATQRTMFRSPHTLPRSVVDTFIGVFVASIVNGPKKDGAGVFADEFNYVYCFSGGIYTCIVTSYPPHIVEPLLFSESDVLNTLSTIDDSISMTSFYPLRITNIESQEEKLHELAMKNRALARKAGQGNPYVASPLESKLEELRIANEARNEEERIKDPKEIFMECKKRKEYENDVEVIVKEKMRYKVTKENEITQGDVDGDLSIFVQGDAFRAVEVAVSMANPDASIGQMMKTGELKLNPNLDKGSAKKGVLKSCKPLPMNRNIALVKWGRKSTTLPLKFTYWPSDLEDGAYQVLMEVDAKFDVEGLFLCLKKDGLKDIRVESGNVEIREFIEWRIGDLKAGGSESMEIVYRCGNSDGVFPISVFFTSAIVNPPVVVDDISGGNKSVEYGITNICEVDSYEITS